MSPSRPRIVVLAAVAGLLLVPASLHGQLGPARWMDMTPFGKVVVKSSDVAGGTLGVRGGFVVHPGVKAALLKSAKPGSMAVDLFLDILNGSANTLWVEMQITVPGQTGDSVKAAEIKPKSGYHALWDIKDMQWGVPHAVKVSAYSDKTKTTSLGSMTASLVFDDADKAMLENARTEAAKAMQAGVTLFATVSGWGAMSPEELAAAKKAEEEKHPTPPFEWKESEGSQGTSLQATESDRKSGKGDQGPLVRFDLHATGFGVGENLELWTKWLDNSYMRMKDISVDEKGLIHGKLDGVVAPFRVTVGGMAPGEPISWALVSATGDKRAYARAVIVPIEARNPQGCSASAELASQSGLVFALTFRGFAAGEDVAVTSEYKKENKPSTIRANDNGVVAFPVLFGEGDNGKARATAAGKSCKVALEYKIGSDAVLKR